MLRDCSTVENTPESIEHFLKNNCTSRIKPSMLRDIKTEALLVFARTALERYFDQIDAQGGYPKLGSEEDTIYVYETLRKLRDQLQYYVVNADYLIIAVKAAENYPQFRPLAKYEEPLVEYYNAMVKKVVSYFSDTTSFIPEFLVVCMLNHWIHEEEKSINWYPFLKETDFARLIDVFESNRKIIEEYREGIITELFNIAISVVEKLKNEKYKVNTKRVSKVRKKK